MKHFPAFFKSALFALSVICAGSAAAEYQRVPDPGSSNNAAGVDLKAQHAMLKKFIKGNAKAASGDLDPNAPRVAFGNISQRPASILKSAMTPKGNFTVLCSRYYGQASEGQSYYGTFNPLNGTTSPIYRSASFSNEAFELMTGFIRDNILYIPDYVYSAEEMISGVGHTEWKRFDLQTGKSLPAINFGTDTDALGLYLYSAAYDESEDKVYGLSINYINGAAGEFVVVDLSGPESTWKAVSLGNLASTNPNNAYMANVIYNPADKKLYGFSSNGTFNQIQITNAGTARTIALMEYDDFDEYYCHFPANYVAAGCYSPYDNAFIVHMNSAESGDYLTISIDAQTYEAYLLSNDNPQAYYPMIHCADAYAADNAPDRVSNLKADFSNGNLIGNVVLTTPSTYFNGLAIDGNVDIHILVDDIEVFKGAYPSATSITIPLSVAQGLHNMNVYASQGENEGAKTGVKFYAGYDIPQAPTGLTLLDSKLTWKAPAAQGVNASYGGFLDLSDITYDVYVNNVKVNDEPIAATEYVLDTKDMSTGRSDISVTATSHGNTSAKSASINRAVGKGFELPLTLTPTPEQAKLFEIVDANNDGYKFTYYEKNYGEPVFSMFTTDFQAWPNDWLFLPPIYCDSAYNTYELAMNYVNVQMREGYFDSMDICIGTDPTPSAMGEPFYSHADREQPEETILKTNFTVPAPGTYYIGIHSKGATDPVTPNRYRGVFLKDFNIVKGEGTTAAPGAPTDIKLTAAPYGELLVDFSAKLPEVSLTGDALPADEEITLTVSTESYSQAVSGKPGQTVSGTVATNINGVNTVTMVPGSEHGTGTSYNGTLYVGIDTPLAPQNVKGVVSDDNLSITLTWDPVGEVGAHGGYVDPSEVVYEIWTQESIYNTQVGSAGNNTTFTYSIRPSSQAVVYIGPVAVNFGGSSYNGTFYRDQLGTPYQTPMVEEFGATAFDCGKWTFNSYEGFNNVSWEHCTDPSAFNLNNCSLVSGGGIIGEGASAGKNVGELRAPKASTADLDFVQVHVRYWDCPRSAKMEFWGRTASNQELRKVGELTPSRSNTAGEWADFYCSLPSDFANQGWIEVNLRGEFEGNQILLIDNYEMLQDIDYDLQLASIAAPYSVVIGETPKFNVTVVNSGAEVNSGELLVELLGDDKVLDKTTSSIGRLRSHDEFTFAAEFNMIEDYINYDFIDVRATVIANEDGNSKNDSQSIEVLLYDSFTPIVRDLKVKKNDDGTADLTWSAPANDYPQIESFELAESFVSNEMIDRWTNVDGDGKAPFAIDGLRWTNDDKASAWQVFDARLKNTLDEPRLSPRTGDRMLIARSIQYTENEQPTRSFDWLISPEVKPGTPVSFWYNTISSSYTETLNVWYSTTTPTLDLDNIVVDENGNPIECGAFKKLRNFTKSGSETWEQCEFMLPADAKYFAIVYASYGQYAAMIDDIKFSPVDPGKIAIDGYDVFMAEGWNEPQIIGSTETPGFHHDPKNAKTPVYYVKSIHQAGDEFIYSPLSNPAILDPTGVGEIAADQFVGGGKGHVLVGGAEGETFALYDLEGRVIVNTVITSDRQSFSCPAGIYTARLGEGAVKIIVR